MNENLTDAYNAFQNKLRNNSLLITILLFFPIAAIVMIFMNSQYGVGISPDSISYVSAARSISAGTGIKVISATGEFTSLQHFPPLLSIILSIGENPLEIAKFVNIISFFLVILITGLVFYRRTNSILFALGIQFIILFSKEFMDIFTMAWSEPLFILLVMTGLFSLIEYFYTRKSIYLIIAVEVLAISSLVRYIGLIFVLFIPLCILYFHEDKNYLRKTAIALLSLFLATFPFLLFLTTKSSETNTESIRTFAFNAIDKQKFADALNTLFVWFLPYRIVTSFGIVLSIILLLVIFYFTVEGLKNLKATKNFFSNNKDVGVLGLFIVVYVVSLIISISFFDKGTPLDYRILSIAYIPLIYCILKIMWGLDVKYISNVKYLVLVYLIVFGCVTGLKTINHLEKVNRPFADKLWHESQTINYVKNLNESTKVYTNSLEATHLLAGHRQSALLPYKVGSNGKELKGYKVSYTDIFEKQGSEDVVVYFNRTFNRSWKFVGIDELKELANGRNYKLFNDGIVIELEGTTIINDLESEQDLVSPTSFPNNTN